MILSRYVTTNNHHVYFSGANLMKTKDHPVLVNYQGKVSYFFCEEISISCDIILTYFPYDRHVCALNICPFLSPGNLISLKIHPQIKEKSFSMIQTGQWTIVKTVYKNDTIDFLGRVYKNVNMSFFVKRKPAYFIIHIVVPVIVLATLGPMVFCIPMEAGDKVSFSMTLLLSFTVFQLAMEGPLPQTSDYMPLLGK